LRIASSIEYLTIEKGFRFKPINFSFIYSPNKIDN